MKKAEQHPRVGVGVIVLKNGRVLLGKRKGVLGAGTWAFLGGHLELNETVEACARRESREEAGIRLANIRHVGFTSDRFVRRGKHYVTLYVMADYAGGTVRNCEPEKCEGWEWFRPDALPTPLFLPIRNLLKQLA